MPLGPTTWTPESACTTASLHVLLIGGVVVDPAPAIQYAAVPVVGELVQTRVGHQHGGVTQIRIQVPQRGD